MFALRWLRDPLVRLDLSHSENVIRSIIAVDNFEKECTISFYEEIKMNKNILAINGGLKTITRPFKKYKPYF